MSGKAKLAVAAVVAAVVITPAPAYAADDTYVSLEGQVGSTFEDVSLISASCDPSGVSTIAFRASGTTNGPYPGTFTETGTITIGPQTPELAVPVGGFVMSYDASFVIDSHVLITGTKHLSSSYPFAPGPRIGTCFDAEHYP